MSGALTIEKVTQDYYSGFWLKKQRVLNDVSFVVPQHSVYGLLGPNGAGKTTLIQLLTGVRRPTLGTVLIEGHVAQDPAARLRLGYLPERPYFHQHLTGEELLTLMGSLCGMKPKQIRSRSAEVLKLVGLSHVGSRELGKYSKGMLQRIGIAQAILHDPSVLVLDEPMSGLDPVGRKEMRELLRYLSNQGKTLLFSSHIIEDVETLCDEVVMIKQGVVVGSGTVASFFKKQVSPVEIAFCGIAFEDLGSLKKNFSKVEKIPEGIKVILPKPQELSETLGELLGRNAKVLWAIPSRPSLEKLFEEKAPDAS